MALSCSQLVLRSRSDLWFSSVCGMCVCVCMCVCACVCVRCACVCVCLGTVQFLHLSLQGAAHCRVVCLLWCLCLCAFVFVLNVRNNSPPPPPLQKGGDGPLPQVHHTLHAARLQTHSPPVLHSRNPSHCHLVTPPPPRLPLGLSPHQRGGSCHKSPVGLGSGITTDGPPFGGRRCCFEAASGSGHVRDSVWALCNGVWHSASVCVPSPACCASP